MTLPLLPTAALTDIRRIRRAAAATPTSPFTGTTQVQLLGGEWWEYEFDFGIMTTAEGRDMSGFLAGLQGPVYPFLFEDPLEVVTFVPGTPLVNGAGQLGRTLVTDGWNPTQVVMKRGRMISLGTDVNTRLYQLTADAVSDASGNATLSLWPSLRVAPGDNEALIVRRPQVKLRLIGPVPDTITAHGQFRFSLQAREVV